MQDPQKTDHTGRHRLDAAEIRIRAERRLGFILGRLPPNRGDDWKVPRASAAACGDGRRRLRAARREVAKESLTGVTRGRLLEPLLSSDRCLHRHRARHAVIHAARHRPAVELFDVSAFETA